MVKGKENDSEVARLKKEVARLKEELNHANELLIKEEPAGAVDERRLRLLHVRNLQLERQVVLCSDTMSAVDVAVADVVDVLGSLQQRLKGIHSGDTSPTSEGPQGSAGISVSRLVEVEQWAKGVVQKLQHRHQVLQEPSAHRERPDCGFGVSSAPRWAVPYVAVGGNKFLPKPPTRADDGDFVGAQEAPLTMVDIALGAGGQRIAADKVAALEQQISPLVARLLSLQTTLDTALLPSLLPQVKRAAATEVQETLAALKTASSELIELTMLLPGNLPQFGQHPVLEPSKVPPLKEVCAELSPALRTNKDLQAPLKLLLQRLKSVEAGWRMERHVLEEQVRHYNRTHTAQGLYAQKAIEAAQKVAAAAAAPPKVHTEGRLALETVMASGAAIGAAPSEATLKQLVVSVQSSLGALEDLAAALRAAEAGAAEQRAVERVAIYSGEVVVGPDWKVIGQRGTQEMVTE
eukprot:gene3955-4924_t